MLAVTLPWATSIVEWLGIVGIAGLFGTTFTTAYRNWRRHECHVKGCHRVQWKIVEGTDHVVCRKHHPDEPPSHKEVLNDQKEAQEIS